LVVFLVIFGAIIVVGIYQNPLQKPKKDEAKDYFEIVSAAIEPAVNDRIEENGTVWIIHGLTFQIRAVEGDAHEVVILSWANSEPYLIGEMKKGEIKTVFPPLSSPFGYSTVQQADGTFPVKIRVKSLEAEGSITINLPPEGGFGP